MHKTYKFLFSIFFLLILNFSNAQVFSPYSQYGLGTLHTSSSPVTSAMGGIGAAYSSPYDVNYINPASLADLQLTTFDFGLRLNARSITNNGAVSFTVADGGVNNVSLSFPVIKNHWGMSLGLLPYSFSKYKYSTSKEINGLNYTIDSEGKGSLYKLYLANGGKYKGFKAGINTEFIFGKLENSIYSEFTDNTNNNGSRLVKSMSLRDVVFNAGLQYTFILTKFENRERGKENLEMTVGTYFAPSLKVDAFYSKYLEATNIGAISGNPYPVDTADGGVFKEYSTITVPMNVGAGISIGKKNKWNVGLDYDFKSWVKFNSPIRNNTSNTDEWHVKLGGSILPNIKSSQYFSRIIYRLGGHIGKSSVIHENTSATDFGITFGFGLPFAKYKYSDRSFSNLNVSFEIGALGINKSQNLVENYYNLTLSYTLSDMWFRKQKFD